MSLNSSKRGDDPTFADILRPLSEDEFFAEYYDRKPLHLNDDPEKFAAVMSWEDLTSILNMTAVWSSSSLQLVRDKEVLPPREFCRTAPNRDGQTVLQPDAGKVMNLLQRGASLVANDIDTLTPGLRGIANALESALLGKAQANLYCSRKEHQAFGTHFDTHDVYAMHIAGEKLWRIYETRVEAPSRTRSSSPLGRNGMTRTGATSHVRF
jgi:ribosomal protein L16 Arg81 hydroxylase